MDIGVISMEMSLARVQQNAGISVAKKAMDSQEVAAEGLLKMVEAAIPKHMPGNGIGQFVNTRA
ncbi:putative motility protein [Clostridium sp. WB02_MRS01]|uniref:YjfB family protein n=1 Tax=Clostridium sp. WB02_MRS01 TaxID=2605777 RepID=UPI0012B1B84D|nr:YjfB family protein [Clostridium sp. WB02_MRS01]MSS10461.1 putative motility protein [Clostridium sp. WB02_MRS01]